MIGQTEVDSQPVSFNSARFHRPRGWLWLGLLMLIALTFAVVLIPALLIQPFRPQTDRALEISYTLKRWSPVFTVIGLLGVIVLAIQLWSNSRWWRRALLVIALVLALPPAWFARQNHFEWMFNPLRNSTYVKAIEATFPGDSDMVLAVKIKNEAVAYPVRVMAYHHVVQDQVGGTPICATY